MRYQPTRILYLLVLIYTEPSVESVHYLLLSGLPDTITADGVEGYLSNSFEVNNVVLLGSRTARAEVVDNNESKNVECILIHITVLISIC